MTPTDGQDPNLVVRELESGALGDFDVLDQVSARGVIVLRLARSWPQLATVGRSCPRLATVGRSCPQLATVGRSCHHWPPLRTAATFPFPH